MSVFSRCVAAAAPLILFLGGCASLDPSDDIARAGDVVAERSGAETNWQLPWDVDSVEWDGDAPLSSDTAVRVALQNNRTIRRSVESIVAARADFAQAHLLPNPVVTIALGFPTDGLGGTPMAAGAMQQLSWLWRRPATIDGADAALRSRVLAVSDMALTLVADVRTAHARVAAAERTVALQEENTNLAMQVVELVRTRLDVGEASLLDVNRAELEMRDAEVVLSDRLLALARAKRSLLELLGRADASDDWATATETIADVPVPTETDASALAESQRLDLAAARAMLEGAEASVALAELGQLPDITAGASYRQNFANRPGLFPEARVTPRVFDDGSAQIAKATSLLRSAEIEADRIRQSAIAETRRAWVSLAAQRDVVRTFDDSILALAESNLELARNAFDAGDIDLTTLLDAQRRLVTARLARADRQLVAYELRIELERAVGGSLEPMHTSDMVASKEDSP